MNTTTLTEFLGWASIINVGALLVAILAVMSMRSFMMNMHAKMFGLDKADLPRVYFQYIAYYKIAILVFNLVPYFALRLIA